MVMSILYLPDAILVRIFGLQSMDDWRSCEGVCRRFQAVFDRFIWPRVRRLDINKAAGEKFFINERRMNLDLLRYVFHKCSHIRTVLVDPLGKNRYHFQAVCEVSYSFLQLLCERCPQMTELCLQSCVFSTFYSFKYLRHLPSTLKVLKIDWCRVDESGHDETVDEAVSAILNALHRLETFSLRGTCYGTCTITDRSLRNLPRTLKTVDLSENFGTKIRTLSWARCVPDLQNLGLERISVSSQDLQCLCESCPRLTSLTLTYADQIGDFSPIASLHDLQALRLDGNRTHLTDDALTKICACCSNLTSLSLDCCCALTSSGLKNLANLQRLIFLNVNGIRGVNDDFLAIICSNCKYLTHLQIKYCKQPTVHGLLCLMELSQLESVGLSGQDAVDCYLLEQLRSIRTLKRVETENCRYV